MDRIDSFRGEYRFLSNFWLCKIGCFPSVENAYVASKLKGKHPILLTCSPAEAKRYGRKHELVDEWISSSHRIHVMTSLVRHKFTKHVELQQKLLSTGDAHIEEGNSWNDTFWGVCDGKGDNWLGVILMQIRTEIIRRK